MIRSQYGAGFPLRGCGFARLRHAVPVEARREGALLVYFRRRSRPCYGRRGGRQGIVGHSFSSGAGITRETAASREAERDRGSPGRPRGGASDRPRGSPGKGPPLAPEAGADIPPSEGPPVAIEIPWRVPWRCPLRFPLRF